MNTQLELGGDQRRLTSAATPAPAGRSMMNGKQVFTREAKTVINFESNFSHKQLCDGPTFSAGDACVYKCAFCYVPDIMRKLRTIPQMEHVKGDHMDIVIRRGAAAELARAQLTDRHGRPKFKRGSVERGALERGKEHLYGPAMIYSSPLVDVAGNMELVRETIEICKAILDLTEWHIRLLSKSNFLPKVAEGLVASHSEFDVRQRMVFGVSTGTLDDGLARAFEEGTPLVSKRIQSLHWLQDNGFRTFGMVCPSLPMADERYWYFAREAAAAIRAERCEHVWAEVINLRGESFTRTLSALNGAGFAIQARTLERVMNDKDRWESYARKTFEAHAVVLPHGKLRFLQYVTPASRAWWTGQAPRGAVML